MSYPEIKDEFETISVVHGGKSLARFGDGELKIMHGSGYRREPGPNWELCDELRNIYMRQSAHCIVGTPTMDPKGPKITSWLRHLERFEELIQLSNIYDYYSAFVTRPDSAPWIKNVTYAASLQALWEGKRTVVVCEKSGSMFDLVRRRAGGVRHVRCPRHKAYSVIDDLEQRVLDFSPEIAILSAGPTATCLAHRLSNHGVHAVDLGSCGGWVKELLK